MGAFMLREHSLFLHRLKQCSDRKNTTLLHLSEMMRNAKLTWQSSMPCKGGAFRVGIAPIVRKPAISALSRIDLNF